jgi:hypothetical protein
MHAAYQPHAHCQPKTSENFQAMPMPGASETEKTGKCKKNRLLRLRGVKISHPARELHAVEA